jgi:hypothetical protein
VRQCRGAPPPRRAAVPIRPPVLFRRRRGAAQNTPFTHFYVRAALPPPRRRAAARARKAPRGRGGSHRDRHEQLLASFATEIPARNLFIVGIPTVYSKAWYNRSTCTVAAQWIVLGASRDSAKRPISAFMPLCRFLLADRLAPEALRPLASQLLFGDPLRQRLPTATCTSSYPPPAKTDCLPPQHQVTVYPHPPQNPAGGLHTMARI